MNAELRRRVRIRAKDRCEYCGIHQDFSPLASLQIEHIRPIKHGGRDEEDNLGLACIDCNLAKSSNVAGFDPETGELTPLYHPRQQRWDDHFRVAGPFIIGMTAIGRTTVEVLNMNSEDQIELRASILDRV